MSERARWWLITLSLAVLTISFTFLLIKPAFSFSINAPPRVWAEVDLALKFWDARGVHNTCPSEYPEVLFTDEMPVLEDPDYIIVGLSDYTCGWVKILAWSPSEPYYSVAMECTIVLHEVGHWLGLDHTPTGIMAPIELKPNWDCKNFAKTWRSFRKALRPDPYPRKK